MAVVSPNVFSGDESQTSVFLGIYCSHHFPLKKWAGKVFREESSGQAARKYAGQEI
jgi:hypothetical protein